MVTPAIKKYGGKVLARGPGAERCEGDVRGIVMMIEFESKEAANTFYHSDEYQAAKAVREECLRHGFNDNRRRLRLNFRPQFLSTACIMARTRLTKW